MTPPDRASARPADRKAMLFCPACEHEAPLDGDWSHDIRDGVDCDRTDVTCPECGYVVVSQPKFNTNATGRLGEFPSLNGGHPGTMVRPVLQFVNAVVRHDVL